MPSVRRAALIGVASLFLIALALPARAGDPTIYPIWPETDDGSLSSPLAPLSEPCPTGYPYGSPTFAGIAFKTGVPAYGGGTTSILLDYYAPNVVGSSP